jgi:hypothetical protein
VLICLNVLYQVKFFKEMRQTDGRGAKKRRRRQQQQQQQQQQRDGRWLNLIRGDCFCRLGKYIFVQFRAFCTNWVF